MILDFSVVRPAPNYPLYPGNYVNPDEYLEQYFYKYYINNILNSELSPKRFYIPIFWTNLFVDNHKIDVQQYINALDWSKKWFTVCQMDDGVRYNLPPDTKVFHAGGNSGNGIKIPIPLIASAIPENYKTANKPKDIFASFVGSMTHPIRQKGYDIFHNNSDFYFNKPKQWQQTVEDNALQEFIDITERSTYCLCFAGYGDSSFRLYQSIELGAIPVYIAHRGHWLPFTDEIDWNEFCVLLTEDDIPDLENILKSIPESKQQKMLDRGKEVWEKYFTMESVCKNILKRLS
jgi:hypothetical protein